MTGLSKFQLQSFFNATVQTSKKVHCLIPQKIMYESSKSNKVTSSGISNNKTGFTQSDGLHKSVGYDSLILW